MAEIFYPHRGVEGFEKPYTFEEIQNLSEHVFSEVLDFVDDRAPAFVLLVDAAFQVLCDKRKVSSTHFSNQKR